MPETGASSGIDRGMILGLLAGIITGVLLLRLFIRFMTKKGKNTKPQYDERQEQVRGLGYKYAFTVLAFFNMLNGIYEMLTENRLLDSMAGAFTGVAMGMFTYATYCIWNEGYVSLNQNPKKVCVVLGGICVVNLIYGVLSISDGSIVQDGMLTFRSVNLIAGLVCMLLLPQMWLKHYIDTHREQDEEDDE